MQSEKKSVRILAEVLKYKGLNHIVFSPGSRNAPIVIQLVNDPFFHTVCLPDERSAGFFALGISQWTRQATVLCCTSGTASLNYAPAIAEAFYQNIPLLVITADRPVEWIDHGEGQSIRQKNIYHNYIKAEFEVPQNIKSEQESWYCNRIINEAANLCTSGWSGPVHLNFPFSEPLYHLSNESNDEQRIITAHKTVSVLQHKSFEALKNLWKNTGKKMLICGLLAPNHELNHIIEKLINDPSVFVLTETTSNIKVKNIGQNIDRILATLPEDDLSDYIPELIITIGGPVVSKKLKSLFRTHKPKYHWHVGECFQAQDIFTVLSDTIPVNPKTFLGEICQSGSNNKSNFNSLWHKKDWESRVKHEEFVKELPFSDLSAYRDVLDYIPDNSVVQMANSTAVRYVQLFDPVQTILYFGNRGTSGIDGSSSTALGSAYVNEMPTYLLTGDMSFIYDSNAFWNAPLKNIKIIVFNNAGGNIFRIIEGPDSTKQLEAYFEVKHDLKAKSIADMYGLAYYSASSNDKLNQILPDFFNSDNSNVAILEIFTDSAVSPEILRSYFNQLKS